MYAVAHEAIARARAGEGPSLIEAMTYRFHGHVFGDADGYMDKGRKGRAMEADPVPRYRAQLIAESIATEGQLAGMEAAIEAAIDEAVEHALASPFPGIEELQRDVFAEEMA
jgi:TPP-dependent pyruvate/acetoin dehydrogenase alpha subunit